MHVDVWWSRLEEARGVRRNHTLDSIERARRDRFISVAATDRFILGTALARAAVSAATGIPAKAVPLDRTCPRCGESHGPPSVRLPADNVSVSITHSGDLVGVALTRAGEVGLDVEPKSQPIIVPAIEALRNALHDGEVVELNRLADADRELALISLWTQKEAVLKAAGLGFGVPAERLRISVSHARIVEWSDFPAYAERTVIRRLSPDEDHVAALATLAPRSADRLRPTLTVTELSGAALLGDDPRRPWHRRPLDVAPSARADRGKLTQGGRKDRLHAGPESPCDLDSVSDHRRDQ